MLMNHEITKSSFLLYFIDYKIGKRNLRFTPCGWWFYEDPTFSFTQRNDTIIYRSHRLFEWVSYTIHTRKNMEFMFIFKLTNNCARTFVHLFPFSLFFFLPYPLSTPRSLSFPVPTSLLPHPSSPPPLLSLPLLSSPLLLWHLWVLKLLVIKFYIWGILNFCHVIYHNFVRQQFSIEPLIDCSC